MNNFSELKEKFNSLESRERKILLSGIIFVVFFVIYSGIYKPMTTSIERLQESNSVNYKLRQWMAESAASIKSSPGSASNKSNKRRGRSLNQVINSTSSSAKISISRSQPRDNNQYQIWLEQVVFNDLLLWLYVLQNDYGVHVSTINLSTIDKEGYVRANLTFQDTGN